MNQPEAADTTAITRERVAARAYELYLDRGREEGQDVADWLQAEAELLEVAGTPLAEASTDPALRPRLGRARRPESVGA